MDEKNLKNHDFFLKEALKEAKKAYGFTSPNPAVGAVAVKCGKIVARGFHLGPGRKHAEIMVLDQLNENVADVSLYVTLEPCGHWGRTPPCVDAIFKRGIQQVIYGFDDPNPIVKAHLGCDRLHHNGVDVLHYPIPEIDEFYQSYAYWHQTKKPFVVAKWAQSIDAKVGLAGKRVLLSNQAAFEYTHQGRLQSDILLTTANTVIADNSLFNVRLEDKTLDKPLAVIDSYLRLKGDENIFSRQRPFILYHLAGLSPKKPIAGVTYQSIHPLNQGLDLSFLMHDLGERGYHSVWVEACPRLMHQLHRIHLVNKTHIYICPIVVGHSGIDAFYDSILFEKRSLQWQQMDDNMRLTIDW